VAEIRDDLNQLVGSMKALASPFRTVLSELHAKHKAVRDGAVANYIPELAKANPDWFGISVVTVDGTTFDVGDHGVLFTIQSVSKPFVYGMAIEDHGREHTLSKVGVEPTGDAFNSLIRLDERSKRPHNPMVNAGAIATADLIEGADPAARINRLLEGLRRYAGRSLAVDASVFMSERSTGHRNRAIAHLLLNFGMVGSRLDETLDLYFQQCSALVNCHDLAVMGATLANGGVNPVTGERAIDSRYVKDVLSVMYSCGMYDFSGEWGYEVGLPAKSGVGGGIVAVVPGQLGIGVFSPLLDARGNSVRGIRACMELSRRFGLHVFEAGADCSRLAEALSARTLPVR
jgi:glutaminase